MAELLERSASAAALESLAEQYARRRDPSETAVETLAGPSPAQRYLREVQGEAAARAFADGSAAGKDPGPAPHARARFLVVDDIASVREVLARMIRAAGHEAVTASDGREALAVMDRTPVAGVFCDIRMPTMNGLEFLSALRSRGSEAQVVFVTGLAETQCVIQALQGGARDFILKPFDAARIQRAAGAIAAQAALHKDNERLRAELERQGDAAGINDALAARVAELAMVNLIDERLGAVSGQSELFEETVRLAAHVASAEQARLWRYDAKDELLRRGPCRGRTAGAPQALDAAADRRGAAACARTRLPVEGPGPLDADATAGVQGAAERLHVPIVSEGELYGVLEVGGKYGGGGFDGRDRALLLRLADKAARLYERRLLLEGMSSAMMDAVGALVRAIGARDHYTFEHSERVARLSVETARRLGVPERDIPDVHAGAFLHDVGKIGVADGILLKEGRLSPDEFDAIKQHPAIGATIIGPLAAMYPGLAPIVRSHHERWDGRGYPDGLAGEAIPLTARIVCVADVYDALNSNRPYRAALDEAAALSELKQGAGSQFDPRVVEAFIQVAEGCTNAARPPEHKAAQPAEESRPERKAA